MEVALAAMAFAAVFAHVVPVSPIQTMSWPWNQLTDELTEKRAPANRISRAALENQALQRH